MRSFSAPAAHLRCKRHQTVWIIRVTKLSNLWYLLHGSATTVRCGHNIYNLIGHREVVYVIWPPQFIVIKGHNWKVSEMPNMVTAQIPLTMVQRCQIVFILKGLTARLFWETLAFHYAVQNRYSYLQPNTVRVPYSLPCRYLMMGWHLYW